MRSLPLLLFGLTGCGASTELGESDLLLLWTSNVHGYIEPCGCQFGMIGGIDRIATYIEEQSAAHPASLWIDAGDLVAETLAEDDRALRMQLPLKARVLLEVWGELGCDGLALGENELALGHERLRSWSEEFDVPILCANLVDGDGDLVFEESLIVERGGLRIGVFSVLAPELGEAVVESKKRVDVAGVADAQGLRLLPARLTAVQVAEKLDAECDLVLFASHAGYDSNLAVAEATDAIDLAFGGHFGKSRGDRTWTGRDVPVLVSLVRGSRVGRVEWWIDDEDELLGPGGRAGLNDVSDWVASQVSLRVEQDELADLEGREPGLGIEEWERQHAHHANEVARIGAAIANRGVPPRGNKLAAALVPMHFGLDRSEVALAAIDEYHVALNEFWRGRNQEPIQSDLYVGAMVCQGCHPAQYEFWRATRHSRAFSTLEATGQEVDAECIGCHTVGYQESSGFQLPNKHVGFEDVQCAACHGPGGRHMKGGESFLQPGNLTSGAFGCTRCHNKEHDPDFEEQALPKLALVACPPLEPPGQGSEPLRETYRVIAQRAEARIEPDWESASHLWYAAGDLERSLQAGERWFAEDQLHHPALVLLGMRYLEVGRHEDARPLFNRVVASRPNNASGHLGLGAAWLPDDPQRAWDHAREAFSIRQNGDAVELELRALLAMGRKDDARDVLMAWISVNPRDSARFESIAMEVGAVSSG